MNVADDVIHHQTNDIIILHIHSVQRVQEIFTISNLCAVSVESEENIFTMGGKIQIERGANGSGNTRTGFVTKEDDENITVELTGNDQPRFVTVRKPEWQQHSNDGNGKYVFHGGKQITAGLNRQIRFYVTDYQPLRFRISFSTEKMSMIVSRIGRNKSNKLIDTNLSS